ncbi:hypothetical protein [Methanothermobacter sp. KEPCO 2]|uniref:hypothetical protein n=1 Tax=Methanothermobacter sp. KEPCO 2 TaxID=3240977 RepID=UPI003512407D
MKRAIILILILILIQGAYAHQPRLVSDDEVTVKNPEVSQAFYGKLAGKPVYFRVDSGSPFKLYVNILVPLSPDAEAVSVDIIRDGKVIGTLDGNLSSWSPYFEEFGGDSYFNGPEFNRTVGAGTYYLRVSNQNNRGSYVLAVGEEESFPPDEALNAIFILPILKSEVFGVPVLPNLLQFSGHGHGDGVIPCASPPLMARLPFRERTQGHQMDSLGRSPFNRYRMDTHPPQKPTKYNGKPH